MKFTKSSRLLWLPAFTLSMGAALATSAQAAPAGQDVYVGSSIALTRTSSLGSNIDGSLGSQGLAGSTSTSTPSVSPGLRLGYLLTPNLALEASYDRTGSVDLQSAISSPATDSATGTWKSHGIGLHALGIVPIDKQWSVYGRVGAEQWHTSLSLASVGGGTTAASSSGSNTSLALGAGTAYAVSRNIDATAELIHYNRVGTSSTGTSAVNQVSMGLRYHFL